MVKGKYKMPSVQHFLQKKIIYDKPKKEPVWVYLEKEMWANIDKKPYNELVGEWLRFLRDLKFYFYCEAKRKYKRLLDEVGPPWYYELSSYQREVLSHLKMDIHQDLLEDIPSRTRKSLSDLGVTLSIPKVTLMQAMTQSMEDPGVFIWNLYTFVYKKSPSELRGRYDMNSMILMSCLVFIDLDECIENLENLTQISNPIPKPAPKKQKKNYKPDVRYGDYLQKSYVPLYCRHPSPNREKRKAKQFAYKFKLRSEESYDRLCKDHAFLEKRKQRNIKKKEADRICTFKFWEPPCTLLRQFRWLDSWLDGRPKQVYLFPCTGAHDAKWGFTQALLGPIRFCRLVVRKKKSYMMFPVSVVGEAGNTNPKMANYASKLKMLRLKAKPKHKAPYKNVQYQVGGVTFSGGSPQYMLTNIALLPTGYILIHGGISRISGEYITAISGFWKFPREVKAKCEQSCDCVDKWGETVMEYLQQSKCRCGHLYDFFHEGKVKEKFFHPPTKHGPFWIDNAKIYQMDPLEDFIKEAVNDALLSVEPTPVPSSPTVIPTGMTLKDLLAALLADLTNTALLIPHLPKANLLNNLQEWLRNRMHGKLTPKMHKLYMLQSLRRWLDLKHMDFRARAYRIPFTLKQLEHMNWSHRKLVQKLFEILLNDFVTRNRTKQLEQTRLWWSTTKYDAYPSKPFLDIYFTYMPGRMKDTFLINPYSSELTPKFGAKTCPL